MTCVREQELLDALGRGYIGAELDAHAAACAACRELRAVAGALLDDRVEAVASAPVPSAGTMWWRMQMRLRQEAESAARRSLFIGQAVTLAIAMTLVFAIFGGGIAAGMHAALASVRVSTPMLLVIVSWVLLAPVAGWIAFRHRHQRHS